MNTNFAKNTGLRVVTTVSNIERYEMDSDHLAPWTPKTYQKYKGGRGERGDRFINWPKLMSGKFF